MAGMVRIVLLPKDGTAAGDRQIIVDMLADAGGVAVGPFPAFGRIGDWTKPETLRPFTLMGDGRLDFGVHAPADASRAMLALRGAALSPGVDIAGTAGPYTIATVTPLVADQEKQP